MKINNLFFPIVLFAAFTLTTSCDKDETESGCEATDADDEDTCDISEATICYDEETGDSHYEYKGKSYSDVNALIDVMCPKANSFDKLRIRDKISAQAHSLMLRIRARAL